jgi:hypothetical protein
MAAKSWLRTGITPPISPSASCGTVPATSDASGNGSAAVSVNMPSLPGPPIGSVTSLPA